MKHVEVYFKEHARQAFMNDYQGNEELRSELGVVSYIEGVYFMQAPDDASEASIQADIENLLGREGYMQGKDFDF
jgi:hypothetical protein